MSLEHLVCVGQAGRSRRCYAGRLAICEDEWGQLSKASVWEAMRVVCPDVGVVQA